MIIKLLTIHFLEFLSVKEGCTGSSESTLVILLEITCRGSIIKKITYCSGKAPDCCTLSCQHIHSFSQPAPDKYI